MIVSSVVSILTVVDLPAPFGPRKPNTSPASTRRSTPRTASIVAVGLDQPPRLDGGRAVGTISVRVHGHKTDQGAGTHRICLLQKCCRSSSALRHPRRAGEGVDRSNSGAAGCLRPGPTNRKDGRDAATASWSGVHRDVRAGVRRRRDRGDRGGEGRQPRGGVRVRPVAAGDGVRDRPGVGLPHQPGGHARAAREPADLAGGGGALLGGAGRRARSSRPGCCSRSSPRARPATTRTSRASAPTATARTRRVATRGARRSRRRSC